MTTKDAERLVYLMRELDGFVHVQRDRYDYAMACALAAGRDEPNEADELNGFRQMVDCAIAGGDAPSFAEIAGVKKGA